VHLRADIEVGLVRQHVLSSTTGGGEDEIGAVLTSELRSTINQFAELRLDADVERLAS